MKYLHNYLHFFRLFHLCSQITSVNEIYDSCQYWPFTVYVPFDCHLPVICLLTHSKASWIFHKNGVFKKHPWIAFHIIWVTTGYAAHTGRKTLLLKHKKLIKNLCIHYMRQCLWYVCVITSVQWEKSLYHSTLHSLLGWAECTCMPSFNIGWYVPVWFSFWFIFVLVLVFQLFFSFSFVLVLQYFFRFRISFAVIL